ncbi:MAG TPA: hypothetical protein VFP68_20005 [Burkholderiaceae bacterium]|nr:hypothetical protein [Burkholderiaceae bacterium]
MDFVDPDSLRAHLMARDPMQRVVALHAIELELQQARRAEVARLADEVQRFTERGIPYYAPDTRRYRGWVSRAVSYWERLHRAAGTS